MKQQRTNKIQKLLKILKTKMNKNYNNQCNCYILMMNNNYV